MTPVNPNAVMSTRVPILLQTLIIAASATAGISQSSRNCSEIPNLDEMLLDGAKTGNTTLVGNLLKCSEIDVNTVNSQGFTPLHLASDEGHIDVVAILLGNPVIDINMGDFSDTGWTPLHIACQEGHTEVVKLLLRNSKIDVNIGDSDGWTALYSATYEEYPDIVKLLVEHPHTDVNTKDYSDGYNALTWAAWNGNVDILEGLLSHPKIDVNMVDNHGMTALDWAIYNGKTESEKRILGHLKISFSTVARWLSSDSVTVLSKNEEMLVAAIMGNTTGLGILVDYNESNINTVDSEGRTPLFLASWIGRLEAVKLLLNHSEIDANKGDKLGMTPLFVATKNTRKEVVVVLVHHSKIDVNRSTPNRTSPLIIASQGGHADLVLVLLAQVNVDVNYVTFEGKSAIFYAFTKSLATELKQRSVVELILRCPRADIAIMDEDDKTALDHAKETNRTDIIEEFGSRGKLKKLGQTCCSREINKGLQKAAQEGDLPWLQTFLKCPQVDINLSDKYGFTPLYLASREGHLRVVEMFLENPRTDVNIEVYFENALMVASERGHPGVVELLLKNSKIDVNKLNTRNSKSALIVAAEEGHAIVVSLLLRHDQVDTNKVDTFGESAIHKASWKGYLRVLKLLLRCKETKVSEQLKREGLRHVAEAVDWRETLLQIGQTCCFNIKEGLLRAAWNGDFRAIRGLLQCTDSDINAVDRKGRPPLYLASWRGHIQAVAVLLSDPRIDVNMRVTVGRRTAFSIASEKGHFHIMRMLISQRQTDVDGGWLDHKWTWLPFARLSNNDKNTVTTEESIPFEGMACNSSHFECPTGTPGCIPPAWVCDGEKECEGGYDESQEACGKFTYTVRHQVVLQVL